MLCGLLWSRALLSVSHLLVVGLVILSVKNVKAFVRKPLVTWSCIPLLLYLTGLYQDPLNSNSYDYLLTLLMYPIAGISAEVFLNNERQIKFAWLIAIAISLIYPIGYYLTHISEVHIAYGQGQSLPTFMDKDHVRYGIFLNAGLLFLLTIKSSQPILRNTLIVILSAIIIFMAVRTAWISLVIVLVGGASLKTSSGAFVRKLLLFLVPAFVLAYFFIPTVKQKLNYSIYDSNQFTNSEAIKYSDGTRRMVNYAAWKAITEDKQIGKGWSAVASVAEASFTKHFPRHQPQFGYPFNQWLFWWIGGGIIGLIGFTVWLLFPVWSGIKTKNLPILIWTVVITASCLIESTLSFQYGVFLHAWVIALLWKKDQSYI
jgi:O-antigen ligase